MSLVPHVTTNHPEAPRSSPANAEVSPPTPEPSTKAPTVTSDDAHDLSDHDDHEGDEALFKSLQH